MSFELALYLINILQNVDALLCSLGVVIGFIGLMVLGESSRAREDKESLTKTAKHLLVTAIALFTLSTMIPSEKTMYMILGSKITKNVISNPEVQKISDKVLTILNQKLDELVKERK